jgi:hypothetical protein
MVAIEITEDGVRVGDAIMPAVHPAAELFPTGDAEYVGALAEYFSRHGFDLSVCQPVVLTPDGRLLEGRGRWAACQLIGKVPPSRVERATNPWTYILASNEMVLREMPEPARTVLLGRVPMLGYVGSPGDRTEDPPSRRQLMALSGIGSTSIYRAQRLNKLGTPELIELTRTGGVPLSTAVRMCESDAVTQRRFVERVAAGENPRYVAAPADRKLARQPKDIPANPRGSMRNRHRYVRGQTVQQLLDTLSSLNTLLDAAEGLDPSVAPEEANRMRYELSRQHIAYRRICDLLNERKEQS